MGAVKLLHTHGHGVKALSLGLLYAQPRAAETQREQLDSPGADRAGKPGRTAREVGPDDAALSVGQGAERKIAGLAGDEMRHTDAVAARINIRIGSLHVLIDKNSSKRRTS